jgi:adenine-specific DNA-methyltransferase
VDGSTCVANRHRSLLSGLNFMCRPDTINVSVYNKISDLLSDTKWRKSMTRGKSGKKKQLEQYEHKDKERINNPPVGLVDPETDKDSPTKSYSYDPHLDPQIIWAGKTEHTSFEVQTVSLHVHERIDSRSIIEAVRKKNGSDAQPSLFSSDEENPPLREAVEFYKHKHNWSNRMIAGDSLLVMNSLLEKEGMGGKVQMIYMDPPYGIKYGSNFQPFVNKRDVKDGKDEDLSSEPEMIKAFRDTWELGIHSYLTYMRDRLLLAKKLLHESGSVFVQISDENVHHVRELMDEVFGVSNFISKITFQKIYYRGANYLDNVSDYLIWYAKNSESVKFRPLFRELSESELFEKYCWREDKTGKLFKLEDLKEFDKNTSFFHDNLLSPGSASEIVEIEFKGKTYTPDSNYHWKTGKNGLEKLKTAGRIIQVGTWLKYKRYPKDFPFGHFNNIWTDTVPSVSFLLL